jgi:hypothetical protein
MATPVHELQSPQGANSASAGHEPAVSSDSIVDLETSDLKDQNPGKDVRTPGPSSLTFIVEKPPRDIRDYIYSITFLICLLFCPQIPRLIALAAFTTYCALPALIRLRYPTVGKLGILDDLRTNEGATLSLFASITALFLQVKLPVMD